MPQNNQTLLEKTVADQWQTLPSGLTVIVRPMPGYSSTHVIFATRFGSIDRDFRLDGKEVHLPAGVAHFLEHKMFEDQDGDAFAKYAKTGANANAFTSFDRTCYLFTATQQLDESLDVLLGMVTHPYFTEQTIAKEQGIIGQEICMGENSPGYAGYNVYNIVFCVAFISAAFQGLLLPFAAEKLDMVDDSQNVMKTFSDYQDDQEMQLIQIRLTPGHRYIGKKLKDLNMGDVLVVLIERGDETIIPRGDVLLRQGDVLVLSGETYHGDADTILDELTIEPGDTRIGRRVRDIRDLGDSLIVVIRRKDGNTVVPRGDTRILEGDVLVMNALAQ